MKIPKANKYAKIVGRETYIAEPLELELEKAFESKTGIEASSPEIYENEYDSDDFHVMAPYDIRTEKFEMMMDHTNQAEELQKAARAKSIEERNAQKKAEAEATPKQ